MSNLSASFHIHLVTDQYQGFTRSISLLVEILQALLCILETQPGVVFINQLFTRTDKCSNLHHLQHQIVNINGLKTTKLLWIEFPARVCLLIVKQISVVIVMMNANIFNHVFFYK